MEKARKVCQILKQCMLPHGAWFFLLVPFSGVLLVYSLGDFGAPLLIQYGSYFFSAYTLIALLCKGPSIARFWKKVSTENDFIRSYLKDLRVHVFVSLYVTQTVNLIYALFQLGIGILHNSFWYYSMAVYYLLLFLMRFNLLIYLGKNNPGEDKKRELIRYRFCGVILSCLILVLGFIIFCVIWRREGDSHHIVVVIAMAVYTFTAFTLTLVHLVQYRKYKSPVITASSIISFVAGLVSVLNLESVMLASFGDKGQERFTRVMLSVSGALILLLVFGIGVYMTKKSSRELKLLSYCSAPP